MDNNAQPELRLMPPKEMFESVTEPIVPLHSGGYAQLTTPVYSVELPKEGGVLSWHVGDKFPVKAWPFKEAVYAIDTIKRVIINLAKFLASSPVRYFTALFLIIPKFIQRKIIRKALIEFTDYTTLVFDHWGAIMPLEDQNGMRFGLHGLSWNPQYYCDMVREFRRVSLTIAGDDEVNKKLILAISMILEFDDAYRYRLQDGFGEINKEKMIRDPASEIARVMHLMQSRGEGTKMKFATFATLIPFILRVADFKKTLIRFFSEADLSKLALDETDFYRCLLWGGYRFRGVPDAERASLRILIDAEWQVREKLLTKK